MGDIQDLLRELSKDATIAVNERLKRDGVAYVDDVYKDIKLEERLGITEARRLDKMFFYTQEEIDEYLSKFEVYKEGS